MRHVQSFASSLCAVAIAASAPVFAASDSWFGFGGGYYRGEDYDAPEGQPSGDAQEAKGYELMASINAAGPMLARLRVSWLTEYTSNTAEEVAGLIGLPLAPNAYLAAGVSRLTDVSNEQQSPTVGVPVELLFYPTRGMEFAIHGNLNPDSDFIGVTLAGVFGKQRSQ